MFLSRHVAHEDTHLAVLDFTQSAAPLPGDADRLAPLLGKRRGVEYDHAVGLAQLLADLPGQGREHRLMIPRHISDELLNPLPWLIVQVGNPLARLALELGDQSHEILGGVPDVLRPQEVLDKGFDELIEPG